MGSTDYSEFPFFRDPNYRSMTVGALRALVKLSGCGRPEIQVTDHEWNAMTVRVRYAA